MISRPTPQSEKDEEDEINVDGDDSADDQDDNDSASFDDKRCRLVKPSEGTSLALWLSVAVKSLPIVVRIQPNLNKKLIK